MLLRPCIHHYAFILRIAPFTFAPPPCIALISPGSTHIHPYPIIEIELHHAVSLAPETNSLMVAPVEVLAVARSNHLELQRYKIRFICDRSFKSAEPQHHFGERSEWENGSITI